MARGGKKAQEPVAKAAEQDSSTTYSTRLTTEQKAVVDEAAAIKGWTASNLIRVAAVERAAHIVNMARPNKFKFQTVASTVVAQLCEPGLRYLGDISGAEYVWDSDTPLLLAVPEDYIALQAEEPVYCVSRHLTLEQVQALRRAVQLGGLEFLEAVSQECEHRLGGEDQGLPDPVDPSTLS